jgi:hypothetical protein
MNFAKSSDFTRSRSWGATGSSLLFPPNSLGLNFLVSSIGALFFGNQIGLLNASTSLKAPSDEIFRNQKSASLKVWGDNVSEACVGANAAVAAKARTKGKQREQEWAS